VCSDSGVPVIVESVLGYGDDNLYKKQFTQNEYPTVTELDAKVFDCAKL
jgi:hypothetical protein